MDLNQNTLFLFITYWLQSNVMAHAAKLFLLMMLVVSSKAHSLTFEQAISRINNHNKVKVLTLESKSLEKLGKSHASWGDPMFKVAAKNFPKDSFAHDRSPMTGIEFSISQKIPLSANRSHLEESSILAGKAKYWDSLHERNKLYKLLWSHAVEIKKLTQQKKIVDENIKWINKIITVSKNLYANGKVSQQAILDLQIRKSELRTMLINIKFDIKTENNNLKYLVGDTKSSLDLGSVPWQILKISAKKVAKTDNKELSLHSSLKSKSSMLLANGSAFVPDVTVGAGYTKRANIDGHGDFVTITAQIPIPVSNRRGADYEKAAYDKMALAQRLLDYKNKKKIDLVSLDIKKKRLDSEIDILQSESISFAKNARKITAKAYQLGTATYVALLQSELKLQNLLLKNAHLVAKRSLNILELKFLIGEKLYD